MRDKGEGEREEVGGEGGGCKGFAALVLATPKILSDFKIK